MQDNIVQVSLYLSAIVALILCSAYLLRRVKGSSFQTQGPIKIVSSLSLGIKEKLVLIQVGDKQQIMLAVSPGKIEKIQHFSEPVVESDGAEAGSFQEKLKEAIKGNQ